MFGDRTIVWALEYGVGGLLVVVPLGVLGVQQPDIKAETGVWCIGLFLVTLGVILISCASSMRRRMLLERRIERLEKQAGPGGPT